MRFDIGGSGDNGDFPSVDAPEGVLVLPPVTGTVITWTLVIAGLIGLVVALAVLRGIYTDWLWFDRLGYLSVFTKILWTRVWLFAAGGQRILRLIEMWSYETVLHRPRLSKPVKGALVARAFVGAWLGRWRGERRMAS